MMYPPGVQYVMYPPGVVCGVSSRGSICDVSSRGCMWCILQGLYVVYPPGVVCDVSTRGSICDVSSRCCTLTFQIGVHIRLFIFRKSAALYDTIRVYTFIRFVANPPYTIFIWSLFISSPII